MSGVYCYVTNQPKIWWPETTSVCLSHCFCGRARLALVSPRAAAKRWRSSASKVFRVVLPGLGSLMAVDWRPLPGAARNMAAHERRRGAQTETQHFTLHCSLDVSHRSRPHSRERTWTPGMGTVVALVEAARPRVMECLLIVSTGLAFLTFSNLLLSIDGKTIKLLYVRIYSYRYVNSYLIFIDFPFVSDAERWVPHSPPICGNPLAFSRCSLRCLDPCKVCNVLGIYVFSVV